MHRFPYLTEYVNRVFSEEKTRWDYVLIRPLLLVSYFFLRTISFPLKFILHRFPLGFEAFCIDWVLAVGMKYLATRDAAELLMRHVQIEPLLYRYILGLRVDADPTTRRKLNGIDGEFGVESSKTWINNSLTVGHDLLSYELIDRFDKQSFLSRLSELRRSAPDSHENFSKQVLEENRQHSWQVFGPTNVVILIVTTITLFGDLKTTITALKSFDSLETST